MIIISILCVLNAILLFCNIYQAIKHKKLKSLIADRPKSYELDEFIRDIYSSGAILRVKRIDPDNILVRSPRDVRS